MPYSKKLTSTIMILAGVVLVGFAAAFADSVYAEFLLGANAKNLSFGPTLFRILLLFHGLLLIGVGIYLKKIKAFPINSETKTELEKTPAYIWPILGILTGAALVLRFLNLNADLWVDEVYTLLDFVRRPMGEILTSFPSQNQHLLYSILAHASTNIFGESAFSLRIPAVLFGVASIWALFFLCRKLLGVREALFAAALMTVSYHHIWFSQNARGYTGLLLFTILATRLWLAALEKNQWADWLMYALAIVFGMWVHMTMAFVVAAHGVVYLVFLIFPKLGGGETSVSPERRSGLKPLAAWFLSLTATTQLYALALPEFLREGLHEESNNSEWTNPLWVLTETVQNLSIGFAGLAFVLIGGAFVAFGWWSLFRRNRRAALLMVLPPVFAGSLMLALGHNLFPRFFFFAMGFGIIIVIHGAFELPKFIARKLKSGGAAGSLQIPAFERLKGKVRNPVGAALALVMIAVSLITVPRNYALPKQNFSGAKSFVENQRMPDEKVVAVSIAGEMYGRYFAPQWSVARTETELERLEQNSGEIWLIYTLSPEIKAFHPEMWRIIERDYQTVRIFYGTLNGGEIFVCRKRNKSEETNESSRNFGSSQNDFVRQNADAE